MLKKYLFKFFVTMIAGFVLYGTNPNYEHHELRVSKLCQSKISEDDMLVCPLGYGKKIATEFDRRSFSVYSAGILSYSTYQEKFSSFGIFHSLFKSFCLKLVNSVKVDFVNLNFITL